MPQRWVYSTPENRRTASWHPTGWGSGGTGVADVGMCGERFRQLGPERPLRLQTAGDAEDRPGHI
jgi:hypothetical protein